MHLQQCLNKQTKRNKLFVSHGHMCHQLLNSLLIAYQTKNSDIRGLVR